MESVPRLVVFSHPNHELAIFGVIQRLRPRLLYLTDGGSAARVADTRDIIGRSPPPWQMAEAPAAPCVS